MVKVELAGIALSSGEAATRPLPILETDIQSISSQTAGKVWVGIKGIEKGNVILGLAVDDKKVEIFQNEKQGGTFVDVTAPGKFEPYAIDLPMRIIGPEDQKFPADHSITVFWGSQNAILEGWMGSATFIVRLTGISPKVKYNPKTDGD